MSALLDQSRQAGFDEDAILVDRHLKGDPSAFEALYTKYYEKVFAISRGILLDPDEAADAVQEIFTLVYRHIRRFDQRSKFSTWLFRVAVNRSIQEARKHRFKHKALELTESSAVSEAPELDVADPQIQAAMAQLSPNDRALLVLFYWEELNLNEIAESLGCGVNAAKTRLYRARERFRVLYEGEN